METIVGCEGKATIALQTQDAPSGTTVMDKAFPLTGTSPSTNHDRNFDGSNKSEQEERGEVSCHPSHRNRGEREGGAVRAVDGVLSTPQAIVVAADIGEISEGGRTAPTRRNDESGERTTSPPPLFMKQSPPPSTTRHSFSHATPSTTTFVVPPPPPAPPSRDDVLPTGASLRAGVETHGNNNRQPPQQLSTVPSNDSTTTTSEPVPLPSLHSYPPLCGSPLRSDDSSDEERIVVGASPTLADLAVSERCSTGEIGRRDHHHHPSQQEGAISPSSCLSSDITTGEELDPLLERNLYLSAWHRRKSFSCTWEEDVASLHRSSSSSTPSSLSPSSAIRMSPRKKCDVENYEDVTVNKVAPPPRRSRQTHVHGSRKELREETEDDERHEETSSSRSAAARSAARMFLPPTQSFVRRTQRQALQHQTFHSSTATAATSALAPSTLIMMTMMAREEEEEEGVEKRSPMEPPQWERRQPFDRLARWNSGDEAYDEDHSPLSEGGRRPQQLKQQCCQLPPSSAAAGLQEEEEEDGGSHGSPLGRPALQTLILRDLAELREQRRRRVDEARSLAAQRSLPTMSSVRASETTNESLSQTEDPPPSECGWMSQGVLLPCDSQTNATTTEMTASTNSSYYQRPTAERKQHQQQQQSQQLQQQQQWDALNERGEEERRRARSETIVSTWTSTAADSNNTEEAVDDSTMDEREVKTTTTITKTTTEECMMDKANCKDNVPPPIVVSCDRPTASTEDHHHPPRSHTTGSSSSSLFVSPHTDGHRHDGHFDDSEGEDAHLSTPAQRVSFDSFSQHPSCSPHSPLQHSRFLSAGGGSFGNASLLSSSVAPLRQPVSPFSERGSVSQNRPTAHVMATGSPLGLLCPHPPRAFESTSEVLSTHRFSTQRTASLLGASATSICVPPPSLPVFDPPFTAMRGSYHQAPPTTTTVQSALRTFRPPPLNFARRSNGAATAPSTESLASASSNSAEPPASPSIFPQQQQHEDSARSARSSESASGREQQGRSGSLSTAMTNNNNNNTQNEASFSNQQQQQVTATRSGLIGGTAPSSGITASSSFHLSHASTHQEEEALQEHGELRRGGDPPQQQQLQQQSKVSIVACLTAMCAMQQEQQDSTTTSTSLCVGKERHP